MTPLDLYEAFQSALAREGLWARGSVLVAVSGGADSVCLLDLFHRLSLESHFPLAVAHLNHALRGKESEQDQEFVASLAAGLGLACHVGRLEPGELEGSSEGIEAAARRARYRFLRVTARTTGASRVALGHTRDDQAETFLLRLLRGSGTRGLGGIYPGVEGLFIRPLLAFGRDEVERYLNGRGLSWRTDSSNADLRRTRNRIRTRLLPLLHQEFNSEISTILARTTGILREEENYLEGVTRELAQRLLRRDSTGVSLAIPALRVLPPALRRRLLRHAFEFTAPEGIRIPPLDFELLEAVENLAEGGRHGAAVTLGRGLTVQVIYSDLCWIVRSSSTAVASEVPLPVPGEAELPDLGLRLKAWEVDAAHLGDPRSAARPERALLDAESLPGPLAVRSRRTGDVFRPLGCAGDSKLKSYLIDRKVPRPARERIPLVVSGGRIAWVVGYQIDDRFKVTPETRRVLVLSKEAP